MQIAACPVTSACPGDGATRTDFVHQPENQPCLDVVTRVPPSPSPVRHHARSPTVSVTSPMAETTMAEEHPLFNYIRQSELGTDLRLETPFGGRAVSRHHQLHRPAAPLQPPSTHTSAHTPDQHTPDWARYSTPTTRRAAARSRSSKTTCAARCSRRTATRTRSPRRPAGSRASSWRSRAR